MALQLRPHNGYCLCFRFGQAGEHFSDRIRLQTVMALLTIPLGNPQCVSCGPEDRCGHSDPHPPGTVSVTTDGRIILLAELDRLPFSCTRLRPAL
jgi:hypothetical protein